MAFGKMMLQQEFFDAVLQLENPQLIGNRGLAFGKLCRKLLLCQSVVLHHITIALRLLQKAEVLALDIFDECHHGAIAVADLHEDCRDSFQTCQLGGAQAAFSGDQFIGTAAHFTDGNRLQNTVGADAVRQLLQCSAVEVFSRLIGVRADFMYGQLKDHLILFEPHFRKFQNLHIFTSFKTLGLCPNTPPEGNPLDSICTKYFIFCAWERLGKIGKYFISSSIALFLVFFIISQQNSAWRKTVPQKKAHIDTNRADKGFFRLN